MAKTYNVGVMYKFSGDSTEFHTADVYQQLCAHQDIHTYVEGGEGYEGMIEVFIPYGAISNANTIISNSAGTVPEDEFCNSEEG